jgi:hypothetical protein
MPRPGLGCVFLQECEISCAFNDRYASLGKLISPGAALAEFPLLTNRRQLSKMPSTFPNAFRAGSYFPYSIQGLAQSSATLILVVRLQRFELSLERRTLEFPSLIGARMKWRVVVILLLLCGWKALKAQEHATLSPETPEPQTGIIVGTVIDVNNDAVPGATVVLEGPALNSPRTVVSNSNGFFEFSGLDAETPYRVAISANGFATWTSPEITLKPGQYLILTETRLRIAQALTKINVGYSAEQAAAEQVKIAEQQRLFGVIPNFYVVYDKDAAPLTAKMKFKLALRVSFDPVTVVGAGFLAGINQAAYTPNYRQGAVGFGERYGAIYANGLTDIMVGGAILPSLLHQDPRYFYQGTGTNKSRAFHALTSPFVCKGDNGQWQPNYSTMGGNLAAAALVNTYYPASNRGPGLFLSNLFTNIGERAFANLAQEFILRRLTPKANAKNYSSGKAGELAGQN